MKHRIYRENEIPAKGIVVQSYDPDGWQDCIVLGKNFNGEIVVKLLNDEKTVCAPAECWTFRDRLSDAKTVSQNVFETYDMTGRIQVTAPWWDGNGDRPDVGYKCVARSRTEGWKRGVVIWHRKENSIDAVVMTEDANGLFWSDEFRRIENPVEVGPDS